MAENSKVEWCHDTRNLWWGCYEISPGCQECYARGIDNQRAGGLHWGSHAPRLAIKGVWKGFTQSQNLAVKNNEIRRVFVGSMMDIFEKDYPLVNREGNQLGESTNDLRNKYFNEVIPATQNLAHMLLTKRPQNIMRFVPETWQKNFPTNVWIGVSVENQTEADRRIPILKQIPAKVRFLSCEPLLQKVNLHLLPIPDYSFNFTGGIQWVIVGGESGPRKRPFNSDWARSIRDQCKEAGVPYFFKQVDKVKQIPADLMIREFPKWL